MNCSFSSVAVIQNNFHQGLVMLDDYTCGKDPACLKHLQLVIEMSLVDYVESVYPRKIHFDLSLSPLIQ